MSSSANAAQRIRSLAASQVVGCSRDAAIAQTQRYLQSRRDKLDWRVVWVRTAFTPHEEAALALTWRHDGGTPTIVGTITARAHATHAMLRFAGTFTPRRFGRGALVDYAVGYRLASRDVASVLADIKRGIDAMPTLRSV
ncbi:MAG: hypothetical protein NVS2B8_15970 [Vulcanimicrobiaceae bacterium]